MIKQSSLILILLIILCSCSRKSSSPIQIQNSNSRFLFANSENTIQIITNNNIDFDKIELQTDNGYIGYNTLDTYFVKPLRTGQCVVTLFDKLSNKVHAIDTFMVIPSYTPTIEVRYDSYEYFPPSQYILEKNLQLIRGFSPSVYSQHNIYYLVKEMDIVLFSQKQENFHFKSNGKFDNEIRKRIQDLEKGDMIILKNIQINSFKDFANRENVESSFSIPNTVFIIN